MGDGDFEALIRLSKGEWMTVCVVGVNSAGSSTCGRLFCDDLNGASDFCGNDGGDEALILNVSIHLRSEHGKLALSVLSCLVMIVVVARIAAHRWRMTALCKEHSGGKPCSRNECPRSFLRTKMQWGTMTYDSRLPHATPLHRAGRRHVARTFA